ncbi:uncharacterized protein LOC133474111 [Phyllopteryx taeniolatus]|uniref:uncharacterized protein LOC133474111 n=1 Tax=Phyllopteryx taeniolatus TaxID=161469 RepID=UPI002AD4AA14|nr:uncharacterized protein LOC133474111 [Phyllopteryx taeniolatus]
MAVLPHLPENKARITSVFGNVLQMDSTKKMVKKLAGAAAGTAAWVTNAENEHRQELMSGLTVAEGVGLSSGLMRRYREAGQLLYVDRDCCSATGKSKVAAMFADWKELMVRLDVWHLMRRFARGVTTDGHILYGPFMARLSLAIFEWDAEDSNLLRWAKQPVDGSRPVTLSVKELARHCRRRTRGAEETERLIHEVLDHFWEAKDTMGMALLDQARTRHICYTQCQHMACIQDPPVVTLYTKAGEVTRGGIKLPIFRCA